MVSVKVFCFNAFSENTFIIEDDSKCIIVDPGCYDQAEFDTLKDYIKGKNLEPQFIVNTHCHIDHILGIDHLKDQYHIPFYISKNELPILRSAKLVAPIYGFHRYKEPTADGFIEDLKEIRVGNSRWQILDVPGHSPGHIALYNEEHKICLAGDVLFQHSIGRTDLPGGDYDTLIQSIRTKLFIMPDDVTVYPGHGPETTIADEKQNNPFCGQNQ